MQMDGHHLVCLADDFWRLQEAFQMWAGDAVDCARRWGRLITFAGGEHLREGERRRVKARRRVEGGEIMRGSVR
jgi:hypothetical protein